MRNEPIIIAVWIAIAGLTSCQPEIRVDPAASSISTPIRALNQASKLESIVKAPLSGPSAFDAAAPTQFETATFALG